jgi:hypothetical protein
MRRDARRDTQGRRDREGLGLWQRWGGRGERAPGAPSAIADGIVAAGRQGAPPPRSRAAGLGEMYDSWPAKRTLVDVLVRDVGPPHGPVQVEEVHVAGQPLAQHAPRDGLPVEPAAARWGAAQRARMCGCATCPARADLPGRHKQWLRSRLEAGAGLRQNVHARGTTPPCKRPSSMRSRLVVCRLVCRPVDHHPPVRQQPRHALRGPRQGVKAAAAIRVRQARRLPPSKREFRAARPCVRNAAAFVRKWQVAEPMGPRLGRPRCSQCPRGGLCCVSCGWTAPPAALTRPASPQPGAPRGGRTAGPGAAGGGRTVECRRHATDPMSATAPLDSHCCCGSASCQGARLAAAAAQYNTAQYNTAQYNTATYEGT